MSSSNAYYDAIELDPSSKNPRRLRFVATAGAPKAPEEVAALRRDYEAAARVVAQVFADDSQAREELFGQMHMAADRGLRGPQHSVEDGRANLDELRSEIIDRAHAVRNRRLRSYGWYVALLGLPCLLLGFAILLTGGFGLLANQPNDARAWAVAAFLVPAGAIIGVFAEFALRMTGGLQYEQLLVMDPGRWHPGQRIAISVLIAFIFAFLLYFNAVQVGVGGLLLNEFGSKTPALGLAVGGVVGLAFPAVRDIIVRLQPAQKS